MKRKTEQEMASEKDVIVIITIAVLALSAYGILSDWLTIYMKAVMIIGVCLSFVIARMGRERKIGYIRAFLVSSFFSPVIGVLIVLSSPRLEDEEYKEKMLEATTGISAQVPIADQLHKLNELRKEGVLTTEEFEEQKRKLLNA